MDWFTDDDDEEGFVGREQLDKLEDKLFSMFNARSSNKLYKNYLLLKQAHLIEIGKTLFLSKLLSISHRRNNPILELTDFNGKKIRVKEGDLSKAKVTDNKIVTKDSEGNPIELKPFSLKNILDNSPII